MRKLSLLFAAAVMAFSMQTAWAEEADMPPEEQMYEESDGFVGRWHHRGDGFRGRGCDGPDQRFDRQGRHRGDGPGRRAGNVGRGFGPRFMEELDLTDAQKTQMVDVMTENFRNRLLARMELHDAIAKLRDLNQSDSPSYDAIVAGNTAVGAAQGKMNALDRSMMDKVRAILTPEQIQKLDDRSDRRELRRDRDDRPSPREGRSGPDPRQHRGPGHRMAN